MSAALPLAGLSLTGLLNLYRAHEAAGEGLLAIYLRSSVTDDDGGREIEAEMSRSDDILQAIAQEAERRQPTTRSDHEARGEILVAWAIRTGDWNDLAAAANDVVAAAGRAR